MEIWYSAQQLGISKTELLAARYPRIDFKDYVNIDESRYGFVDDISQYGIDTQTELAALQTLSDGNIITLSEAELTLLLVPGIEQMLEEYGNNELLMIYPGGGGRRFRRALEPQLSTPPTSLELDIHRDKETRLPNMSQEGFALFYEYLQSMPELKRIVVGDDVVNGGSTLKEMYSWVTQKNIEWVSLSPVMLYPELYRVLERPSPTSIANYTEIRTTLLVDGPDYPAPFNCASSLLKKGDLSQDKRIRQLQEQYGDEVIEPLISMQQKCRQFTAESGEKIL